MPDINLEISALHEAYADGLAPTSVVTEVYRRIEEAGDAGIFIALEAREAALARAAELRAFDPGKPLWGVPFAVKDNIDIAGMPTTAACPAFAYTPHETAPAVSRMIEAGAILIGKTNLDQFATGLVGLRSPYPIPKNAVDPSLVPGGSSSGSAVAVARKIVSVALGTDTAGSGRVPAALNGIVGLKPSLGALSSRGVVPACRTLDTISVFAQSVEDAWRAYEAMAGFDPADPYSRPISLGTPFVPPLPRVGVPDAGSLKFFGDAEAEAAFARTIDDLRLLGAEAVPVDFSPFLQTARLLYDGPWIAERYQAIRGFFDARSDEMHPVTRAIIGGAKRFSAADAFAGLYALAALKRKTERVWSEVDVLMTPSIPTLYTVEQVTSDPITLNSRLGTYTNFVNLLDLAAIAVPSHGEARRPRGVTLIAPRGADALIAGLGDMLHDLGAPTAAGSAKTGKLSPPQAAPGMIEVAVFGAHMSGLPLNAELKALGAVFLREAQTAPAYRLFALRCASPKRPALLRVNEGEGSAIACEIWALPPEGLGRLVGGIPAPLGIATVQLTDGSCKGFVVESEGVRDAIDITEFGGWRNYIAQAKS